MTSEEAIALQNTIVECCNTQTQNSELIVSCLQNLAAEIRKQQLTTQRFMEEFKEWAWGGAKNSSTFVKRFMR